MNELYRVVKKNDTSFEELMHYGVKGMKWRNRRKKQLMSAYNREAIYSTARAENNKKAGFKEGYEGQKKRAKIARQTAAGKKFAGKAWLKANK